MAAKVELVDISDYESSAYTQDLSKRLSLGLQGKQYDSILDFGAIEYILIFHKLRNPYLICAD